MLPFVEGMLVQSMLIFSKKHILQSLSYITETLTQSLIGYSFVKLHVENMDKLTNHSIWVLLDNSLMEMGPILYGYFR